MQQNIAMRLTIANIIIEFINTLIRFSNLISFFLKFIDENTSKHFHTVTDVINDLLIMIVQERCTETCS
jgi:hypothetical protein